MNYLSKMKEITGAGMGITYYVVDSDLVRLIIKSRSHNPFVFADYIQREVESFGVICRAFHDLFVFLLWIVVETDSLV
jgi:hypothetical protein